MQEEIIPLDGLCYDIVEGQQKFSPTGEAVEWEIVGRLMTEAPGCSRQKAFGVINAAVLEGIIQRTRPSYYRAVDRDAHWDMIRKNSTKHGYPLADLPKVTTK